MTNHLTSNFSTFGDEVRNAGNESPKFVRQCCEEKKRIRESDLYINEGWERPKSGKVKEQFANNRYEFKSAGNTVFDATKRKSCCKSADWSERKRAREERKVLRTVERKDCFYCDCHHCTSFYNQVLAKHKIPFMMENRSKPSVQTIQRQYHSRKTWRDEYGLRKGMLHLQVKHPFKMCENNLYFRRQGNN